MSKPKTSRMGRPPLPKGAKKDRCVLVRLTPALHAAMTRAAKRGGKPLATWMRDTLVEFLEH
jgi:predicted HicB family RNase H-like nuclease